MIPKIPLQPQIFLNNIPFAFKNEKVLKNSKSIIFSPKYPTENNTIYNNNNNIRRNSQENLVAINNLNYSQNKNINYNLSTCDKYLNIKTNNFLYKTLTISPKMQNNNNNFTIKNFNLN
jgi:hypothetical protein